MGRDRIILKGHDETIQFGIHFASKLSSGAIIALQGDLGTGKTTFVQGLLQGLGISDTAQSPTFTYLQIYQSPFYTIYHFDLYRLGSTDDFLLLGFNDFFPIHKPFIPCHESIETIESEKIETFCSQGGFPKPPHRTLIVLEWPERIASLLCSNTILIRLYHDHSNRRAEISTWGKREV